MRPPAAFAISPWSDPRHRRRMAVARNLMQDCSTPSSRRVICARPGGHVERFSGIYRWLQERANGSYVAVRAATLARLEAHVRAQRDPGSVEGTEAPSPLAHLMRWPGPVRCASAGARGMTSGGRGMRPRNGHFIVILATTGCPGACALGATLADATAGHRTKRARMGVRGAGRGGRTASVILAPTLRGGYIAWSRPRSTCGDDRSPASAI